MVRDPGPTGISVSTSLRCRLGEMLGQPLQVQKRHSGGGAVLQDELMTIRYTGCPTRKNAWI